MPLRWLRPVLVLTLFSVSCARESAAADFLDPKFKVSLGYHYSTGTYGTSSTTEIAYIPLIAKAEIGSWSIQATLPYLRIDGPAGVFAVGDTVVPSTGGQSDGLGDIILHGAYTLAPQIRWMPFVEMAGLVKFPTASRGAGLGTGRFDYGVESTLFWSVAKFTPFATVGYRVLGSPPGINLHDVVLGSVGGMYRIVERVHGGLFLDYRQAPSSSIGERLELVPFGSWQQDEHWSVDLYASAGFTKGSPDAGTGLQLAYTW